MLPLLSALKPHPGQLAIPHRPLVCLEKWMFENTLAQSLRWLEIIPLGRCGDFPRPTAWRSKTVIRAESPHPHGGCQAVLFKNNSPTLLHSSVFLSVMCMHS